jgi:hypothetical protein
VQLQQEEDKTKELPLLLLPLASLPFPWWKQQMPKVLIVVSAHFEARGLLSRLASGALFFFPIFWLKKKSKKIVSHQHSRHTVCAGVSCMTEEGCHSSVSVCLVSGTGSAVRKVEGVFSVFLSKTWHLAAHIIRNALS